MKLVPLPPAALSLLLLTHPLAGIAQDIETDTQTTAPTSSKQADGASKDDDSGSVELDAIVVTGRREAPYAVDSSAAAAKLSLSPRDTPQSISIVTRERLDDQNLQSLRDVLDNTPGIYSYAYDTERVVFTARGFFIDSVMYDGVPAAANFNTSSADETLDTGLYERIEIVRGATGLMTGAGSPSASVNLVRKHADSRDFEAMTALSVGNWNDTRPVMDVSTPLTRDGRVRARAVGVYQYRESYQDYYENEKQVFYAVVDADLAPGTQLSLGYDYQETQPQGNTWGSFPLFFSDGTRTDWPRSVTTAPKWTFWDKRKQTYFAELRQDLAAGWTLRSTLSHRQADDDLALFYVYGYPDPADGTGLFPYAYRNTLETVQDALDVHVSGPVALFGRVHELVAGYNGSRVDIGGDLFDHGELADPGNFFEWDGSYPMPEFAAQGTSITDIDTRQHGLYVATRLSIAEPLKLIAGARYNAVDVDYYDVYTYGQPLKQDRRKTTPYAGLIYDLDASWSLFTSFTTIFNPQQKQDPGGVLLEPIEGRSVESGIKGEHFGGQLNTALTLFDTRMNGAGVPATDEEGNPIYLQDGITQASVPVDARTRGVEIEAFGSPLPGWNLSAGASHYRLEDAEGDSVKTYIPRTLVRVFTTWTPPMLSPLTVGGSVNWQSKSDLDVASPQGLTNIEQGDVTLLGLMARYQFTPALSAQLNGSNLLDRTYYVLDEYGNLYYGAPASVSATFSYRF